MERFLTHIVQRSLASSPALAPRLAGRYEEARAPVASASGEQAIAVVEAALAPAARRAEQASADFTGRPEPASDPVANSAPRTVARPAQPDPPEPGEQKMQKIGAEPGTEKTAAAAPPGPGPVPILVPVPVAVRAGTLTAPPAQRLIADETSPAPARPLNGEARTGPLAAHPAPRIDAGESHVDAPAPAGSDPAGSDPDFPGATIITTMRTTATSTAAPRDTPGQLLVAPSVPMVRERQGALQAGALTEPPPRSAVLAAPQPRAAPVQPEAAQPVLVTIGRVELRAAAPAAAPAPPRAAPVRPSLSLGDYLQRRDQAEARR